MVYGRAGGRVQTGHARATTPILSEPLEGPVYLRSNGGERQLPDLVAVLHSAEINTDLVGFVESGKGGNKGLLENSRNLCKSVNRATVRMDGQNGKISDTHPVLKPLACISVDKRSRGKRVVYRVRKGFAKIGVSTTIQDEGPGGEEWNPAELHLLHLETFDALIETHEGRGRGVPAVWPE